MNPPLTRAVVFGGLSLLRSLAQHDIPTIVISRYARDVGRYSRYCNDWRTTFGNDDWDDERVLKTLIDIAAEGADKPVLYYGDDTVLSFISRHRDTLEKYYHLNLPDQETVDACFDKRRFAELARRHHLPVPVSLTTNQLHTDAMVSATVGFPCVIKPAARIEWKATHSLKVLLGDHQKVLIAKTPDQYNRLIEAMPDHKDHFIVQAFIGGDETNVYSFHTYVPRDGNATLCYAGRKIRTYPSLGGESAYVELVHDPEVIALGLEVVDKLRLRGPVKIDLKRDPNSGKLLILEINLRFNLWNCLGTYCGINLALAAYGDQTRLPQAAVGDYRTGIGWLHFGRDLRSFIRCYRPEHRLTTVAWLASLCRPKICSIFSWRDPLPFIMHGAGFLARTPAKLLRMWS